MNAFRGFTPFWRAGLAGFAIAFLLALLAACAAPVPGGGGEIPATPLLTPGKAPPSFQTPASDSLPTLSGGALPTQPADDVQATLSKPEDRIEATWEGEILPLDIFSPSGIGGAQVALSSEPYPAQVLLRFHLKGLEEMTFTYAGKTVKVSVSSRGEHAVTESLEQGGGGGTRQGAPQTLQPGDPHWMEVQLLPVDGAAATIPLESGVIQVAAPPDFIASGERQFSLKWIDFYR